MPPIVTTAGPWAAFISLAALLVFAFIKGWVVSSKVAHENTETWKTIAIQNRDTLAAEQANNRELMSQLVVALKTYNEGKAS